jgi:hypothetical protein
MIIFNKIRSLVVELETTIDGDTTKWEFNVDLLQDRSGQIAMRCFRMDAYKLELSRADKPNKCADEEIYVRDYFVDIDEMRFTSEEAAVEFVIQRFKDIFKTSDRTNVDG